MPPQTEPDQMPLFAGVGNEIPHRSQLRDKHTMTVQSRSARRTAHHGCRHLLLRASCPAARGSVTDAREQRLPRIRVAFPLVELGVEAVQILAVLLRPQHPSR